MKRLRRIVPLLLLSAIVVWALVAKQGAPAPDPASLIPDGALLYIQSPDFHTLLDNWNRSPEKRAWLSSDNYSVFSQSRLFSRLSQAQDEFSAAAGFPANAGLLDSVAGKQSAFALYDIGKLEFVYLTRMDEGAVATTPLWQLRDKFDQRSEAGTAFFIRQDPQSKRVAAFAAKDGWLILGTREDLVAGVLDRLSNSAARNLSSEAWYASAVCAASGAPGDLRMVLNLAKIVPSPYFRSYWVQQNITEMKQYSAAISDLYCEAHAWREERVLLRRAQANPQPPASDVSALAALPPADADFWSAQADPNALDVFAVLRDDLLYPKPTAGREQEFAPPLATTQAVGNASDLETHIDQKPAAAVQTDVWQPLRALLNSDPPTGFLQVYATERHGAFVSISRAMVVTSAQPWNDASIKAAITSALRPSLTVGNLGAKWKSTAEGNVFALDGELSLFFATRGNMLVLANNPNLLAQLLASDKRVSGAKEALHNRHFAD